MKKKIISLTSALVLTSTLAFSATSTSRPVETKEKTADEQMKGTDADVATTRKIREQLADMEELSTRAHNVTIVTLGKNITLKGEVDNQEEIKKIMNVARNSASGRNVTSQLHVHK